ncbi:MAG: amidohydrolase family protein [Chloroflexota bacterium]
MGTAIPERGPFALRARILTPLAAGGTRYEADGRLVVDARGVITDVGPWSDGWWTDAGTGAGALEPVIDLRPLILLPGMVDLHVHLPQLPNAGVGAGLDVLTWLERYTFPLEHAFDRAAAERLAPLACRAFAAAGTTTAVTYGAVYEASLDAAFRAAEAHGIRAVIGKVMMDRDVYDDSVPPERQLEANLRQSADLCARWHGRDDGRLRYAFTPRFAVSCSADLLRESAALARSTGAYWQTHLAESRPELAEVAHLFPDAIDYLDVYDRAGGLGPHAILAHAIHLSEREVARLAASGAAVAHCPASNLFLASGAMPLTRYREAGIRVGLGSDVSGGPELSIFATMRAGAFVQSARRVCEHDEASRALGPLDWLRLGSYDGAQALGQEDRIGSLETGKEADLIAVDPRLVAPVPGEDSHDPAEVMSRLAFRPHPDMVRAAWVRGRRLEGPPGVA